MFDDLTWALAIIAIFIALIFISVFSFIPEPNKQKWSALLIAGAGSLYWMGTLEAWEMVFGTIMLFLAFKGLSDYRFVGLGWLLHTIWDFLHHANGQSLIFFDSTASLGCAICDPVIAVWYFCGAPNIFKNLIFQKS